MGGGKPYENKIQIRACCRQSVPLGPIAYWIHFGYGSKPSICYGYSSNCSSNFSLSWHHGFNWKSLEVTNGYWSRPLRGGCILHMRRSSASPLRSKRAYTRSSVLNTSSRMPQRTAALMSTSWNGFGESIRSDGRSSCSSRSGSARAIWSWRWGRFGIYLASWWMG